MYISYILTHSIYIKFHINHLIHSHNTMRQKKYKVQRDEEREPLRNISNEYPSHNADESGLHQAFLMEFRAPLCGTSVLSHH